MGGIKASKEVSLGGGWPSILSKKCSPTQSNEPPGSLDSVFGSFSSLSFRSSQDDRRPSDKIYRPTKLNRTTTNFFVGSSGSSDYSHHEGPAKLRVMNPTKRARIHSPNLVRCRGNCPITNWTIDQFCEICHG